MTITQEFKNQCETFLLKWQELVGYDWASKDYSDLNKRLKEGKDKILQDPFFTSLKTRTTEEQKHFFKRIEYWYNEKSGLGDVYGLPHCIESVKRTTENTKSNGELAVNIFQLKNDFLKMVEVDKWEEPEKKWYNDNKNYWQQNEFDKSFGDKIDKDSLKKIKDRLDSLTDDKTKLDNQLTTANDTIISLNDTITTLTTQLGERNDTIDNRDSTILDLTNENTKLETEKASLETQLQELQKNKGLDEEVKKLKAQVAQLEPYKQELLKIKRVQTNQELTIFFQAMEISNSLIGKRFKSDEVWKKTYGTNFDYEDIVDEKLTLENRENMKMAFKVVACICATEKAEELKAQLKKIDAKLKKRIDNINENWKVVENYTQIDAKDNPFYLNVINERQKYKTKAENLMNEALQVQPDK